ncbi:hypothetical protein D1007_37509 [Hordeum vulgare]|nr:hypothetical protein D1007_37509 [Hordeum vulgare]
MAGTGAPLPQSQRAPVARNQGSGNSRGQGPRMPHQPTAKPASVAVGVQAASSAGESGGHAGADVNRMQPRGRWGDDGVNAYGAGQHRGSSSHGGGRGYAWQSNAGPGQGFSGPTRNFVPGPAGPKGGGYRQRWGGRGGGRRPSPQVDSAAADKVVQAQPEAPPTSLPAPLGAVETAMAADKDETVLWEASGQCLAATLISGCGPTADFPGSLLASGQTGGS